MTGQIQFDLGEGGLRPPYNVLPRDGEAVYYGRVFDPEEADGLLARLLAEIPWENDEGFLFGKRIVTDRKVAWYGDRNFEYKYSGRTRVASEWAGALLGIKEVVERVTGVRYNSCLLNLYADGGQGMSWHSDDEKELGEFPDIASLGFGAERRFDFRHKVTKEKVSVHLEHGSLLEMKAETQANWEHQIPKTKKVSLPRANLTFRRIQEFP